MNAVSDQLVRPNGKFATKPSPLLGPLTVDWPASLRVRYLVFVNRLFNFAMYAASGAPVLVALIESLWLQIGPYLSLLDRSGRYTATTHHREKLLKA